MGYYCFKAFHIQKSHFSALVCTSLQLLKPYVVRPAKNGIAMGEEKRIVALALCLLFLMNAEKYS